MQLLKIVGFQLFKSPSPTVTKDEILSILAEAKAQTVYSTVFPFLRDWLPQISPELFRQKNEMFLGKVMKNTANLMEHQELHALMTENHIPYSAIKGLASAYYYPEASLRDMGDVDFLVNECDLERAKQALTKIGFHVDHGDNSSVHIAFFRNPASIWEQHKMINGIPNTETGIVIQKELDNTIKTSEIVTLDGATCRIPDRFHHGLIMLVHMIAHMTSEGIGLRHLCDWSVFANQIDDISFQNMFEEKLKRCGLWRFAQIITLVSQHYLGTKPKKWAQNDRIDHAQLEAVMSDILNGGNFGIKDMNRYREIKYISNRGLRTVDQKHIFFQAISTLNQTVYSKYKWIERCKLLLPIGWAAEIGKYMALLITGQRQNTNTSAMLREAAKRKEIYSRMRLFESE